MKKIFLLLSACLCLLLFQPALSLAAVIINEICWMGTVTSSNDEWIELFNNGPQVVSLDGWILKSSDEKLKTALKGNIPSQGFFLLERTDDQTVPTIPANQTYQGALSNKGEKLQLLDNNGAIVDEVDCVSGWFAGDNKTKRTMERTNTNNGGNEKINWQDSQNPGGTPKAPNSQPIAPPEKIAPLEAPLLTGQTATTAPEETTTVKSPVAPPPAIVYPKNIFINEVLPAPQGPDEENEWVELYNANNFSVDLSGWKIKDRVGAIKACALPPETTIAANGFLVLPRTQTKIVLQNNGDGLELFDPQGELIDKVDYPSAPNNQSYGRTNNGWSWSITLTPGTANIVSKNTFATTKKEGATKSPDKTASSTADGIPAAAQIGGFMPNQSKQSRILSFIAAIAVALASAITVFFLRKKPAN